MPVNTDVLNSFIYKGLYTSFHMPVNSYCTEEPSTILEDVNSNLPCTLEFHWLDHLLSHEIMFETGVFRA